jgi:hypothetical protein
MALLSQAAGKKILMQATQAVYKSVLAPMATKSGHHAGSGHGGISAGSHAVVGTGHKLKWVPQRGRVGRVLVPVKATPPTLVVTDSTAAAAPTKLGEEQMARVKNYKVAVFSSQQVSGGGALH